MTILSGVSMPIPYAFLRRVTLALGLTVALVAPDTASALEEGDRAQIETIIREYLLANPEIMIEVQRALEAKQQAAREEAQKRTLAEMKDKIYNSPHDVVIGEPDAPITVVEFYDYNCGFCRRALADMERFVSEEKGVKFVLKEFPVLGEASIEAHRVSLAFNRLMPEKAGDFHRKLLSMDGRKDGAIATRVAVELGADEAALKAEMEKPEILDGLREAYQLADGLGITGTPSYVIGEEVVFGAVGFDQLNNRVANLRECGKATC